MSQRQDTCPGRPCPYWKRYKENCPFFVEGGWKTPDGHTYTTKDCAPKRSMILQQQIYDTMIGVHKSHNESRNANIAVLKHVFEVNPMMPSQMDALEAEFSETKLIEE